MLALFCPHPSVLSFRGDPSRHAAVLNFHEVLFTSIERAQFSEPTALASLEVLCLFSVLVPLGSPSFFPLPGFSA